MGRGPFFSRRTRPGYQLFVKVQFNELVVSHSYHSSHSFTDPFYLINQNHFNVHITTSYLYFIKFRYTLYHINYKYTIYNFCLFDFVPAKAGKDAFHISAAYVLGFPQDIPANGEGSLKFQLGKDSVQSHIRQMVSPPRLQYGKTHLAESLLFASPPLIGCNAVPP